MKIETLPFLVVHGALLWKVALGLLIFLSLWRPFRKNPGVSRLKPPKTALIHSLAVTLVFLATSFTVGRIAKSLSQDYAVDDTPRPPSLLLQVRAALPFSRTGALNTLYFATSSTYHQNDFGVRMLAELELLDDGCQSAANLSYHAGYPKWVLEFLENCNPSQKNVRMRHDAYVMLGQFQAVSDLILDATIRTSATEASSAINIIEWRDAAMTHLLAGNTDEAARVLELEAQARKTRDAPDTLAGDRDPRGEARDLHCLATAASLYGKEPTSDKLQPLRDNRKRCRLLLASFLAPEKRFAALEAFEELGGKLKYRGDSELRKLLLLETGYALTEADRLSPLRYRLNAILHLTTIKPQIVETPEQIGLVRRVYNSSTIKDRVERPTLGGYIALYDAQLGFHKRSIQQAEKSLLGFEALLPDPPPADRPDPIAGLIDGTISPDMADKLAREARMSPEERLENALATIQNEKMRSFLSEEMLALHTLLAVEYGKTGDLAAARTHLELAKQRHEKYPNYIFEEEADGESILGQRSSIELANAFVHRDGVDEPYSVETPPAADNFRNRMSVGTSPLNIPWKIADALAVAELFGDETWLTQLRVQRDNWDKALSDPGRSLLYALVHSMP
ncbi:MAG: hypothetical protein JKY56_08435 [Kofleriaceae bacterium]|nr:hypothetical protein [Kofleriaceae bacterium]